MSSQSIIKLKQNTSVSNHVRFKTTVGWFEIQNFKLIYKIPTQKQNSNMKLHGLKHANLLRNIEMWHLNQNARFQFNTLYLLFETSSLFDILRKSTGRKVCISK